MREVKHRYVTPPAGKVAVSVRLPASKSISARVLLIRALCEKKFRIKNLSASDDTLYLKNILERYGRGDLRIHRIHKINTGDGGTTMRFLIAFFAIQKGTTVILNGSKQMNKRPVGILVSALKKLGAEIRYVGKKGYPPVRINGKEIVGGKIKMDGSVSSQFVSALILAAPLFKSGLKIAIPGNIVSLPYIIMTAKLMKYFGIRVTLKKNRSGIIIHIPPSEYQSREFSVEPDWSAASFWYEAAALAKSASVFLKGLRKESLQGDAAVVSLFKNFGVETKFTEGGCMVIKKKRPVRFSKPDRSLRIDFTNHPDLAIPFAFTCAGLGRRAFFTGLNNLSIKESDRVNSLITEINKIGISLSFHSHHDHRIAMGVAPLALKSGTIKVNHSDVVKKSYPAYWCDLEKAGFRVKNILGQRSKIKDTG
ncbi:MAG: 3-phosphoshikimate 1-carboxyvinyltransferase [Bacteroidetes bacterium]|nr:3-phosphoshikimate 1-carboxyvinyltransferase [Bacteroidota bacterium]